MDDKNLLSMKPLWESYPADSNATSLQGETSADVAIIGGGITGITTAQLLKEAGFTVVVLEALSIGEGSSGHSTGNLYCTIEEGFDVIQSKYDTETLQTVINARKEAVDFIEQNVGRLNLDCDFKRQPWYLYSHDSSRNSKIEKVHKAGIEGGAPMIDVMQGELPFEFSKATKLENQAQFNPLRYIQQLATSIADDGCRIFSDTRVQSIHENENGVTVRTTGGQAHAKYVVHATHTPKGLMPGFHSVLGSSREYGIAGRLESGDYPEGIFWGFYGKDRYSVRSYMHNGEKHIIVVGQPHGVGQKENNHENIRNLEKFLSEHFDVAEITHRWGGQNYKPADGLPYIGRKSTGSPIFVATGFSTDGLTYGTLAGMIIRDILLGKTTAYSELFDASRHNPIEAAGKFLKENALNAAHVLKDYLFNKDVDLSKIPTDEGEIVEVEGRKLAVYNNPDGEMKACSAICTHMGCVVHWNGAEKTWDCPCHASRFTTDGEIIEGPALMPLQKFVLK